MHSPSTQRAFDVLCLFYGRHQSPSLGERLCDQVPFCVDWTRRVVDQWNGVLRAYTRVDTGKTFEAKNPGRGLLAPGDRG